MRQRVRLFSVLVVILGAGCSRSDTASGRTDTLTQRQKDSVLGQSQLPGAHAVTRALGAADSASARSARLDSVGKEPR
jgi:hypothetical protein